jgi:hypothetical protein
VELVGKTRWRQFLAAAEKELKRFDSRRCYSILLLRY